MKKPARRLGFIAGFLWAAVTEDSLPPESANRPDDVNIGSYRTARLEGYRPEDRDLAERLFKAAAARLTSGKPHRHKGSYSFVSSSSGETMAKIIIFERGLGRVTETFPIERDGVYILLRVHGRTNQPTIGVAPNYPERFTYARIEEAGFEVAVQKIVAAIEPAAQGKSASLT